MPIARHATAANVHAGLLASVRSAYRNTFLGIGDWDPGDCVLPPIRLESIAKRVPPGAPCLTRCGRETCRIELMASRPLESRRWDVANPDPGIRSAESNTALIRRHPASPSAQHLPPAPSAAVSPSLQSPSYGRNRYPVFQTVV